MLTEEGWIEIERLMPGDIITSHNKLAVVKYTKPHSFGEVVKITVADAHTYLTEGLVSHNVKQVIGTNEVLN
jgi:intein/homing endonuclease